MAYGDVIVRAGSTAALTARGDVVFSDGFSAEAGATLSAYQDAGVCSSAAPQEDPDQAEPEVAYQEAPLDPASGKQAKVASTPAVAQEKVEIYPNPVLQQMHLVLPEAGSAYEVKIYNSFGSEVKHLTLQPGQTEVDVRMLQPGIYYLHSKSEKGVGTTRFRVER
ncbi:T9SS type A sorting domain-containing protein [Hymenobacter cellulosilyticus]|uniref:T9SS type A sorting domain-containing protein n=1 Tax=Hymenobacter cellulosilyticus TaxID=2932248 RepID=A0A8T9PZQ0_9BACT|nr:T9SS type A sorting domain-containing protein [Hymenobacter cellulosilyticus]UOQ70956.1 T9SS type A sorting domain-containing protein [Hymenobacter cellulosilyticus]